MVCTADNFLSRNFVAPLDRRNIIRYNDSATIGSMAISYWRCGMSKPDKSIDPKILEAAKKEFLEMIAEIPCMYVPAFYDIEYNEDGTIKERIYCSIYS